MNGWRIYTIETDPPTLRSPFSDGHTWADPEAAARCDGADDGTCPRSLDGLSPGEDCGCGIYAGLSPLAALVADQAGRVGCCAIATVELSGKLLPSPINGEVRASHCRILGVGLRSAGADAEKVAAVQAVADSLGVPFDGLIDVVGDPRSPGAAAADEIARSLGIELTVINP